VVMACLAETTSCLVSSELYPLKAMWSMLGERPVDMCHWESFGEGWLKDVSSQPLIHPSAIQQKFTASYVIDPPKRQTIVIIYVHVLLPVFHETCCVGDWSAEARGRHRVQGPLRPTSRPFKNQQGNACSPLLLPYLFSAASFFFHDPTHPPTHPRLSLI